MLNINKPLQLADGTSAKFIEINRDGRVKVSVDGDFKSFRLFELDGRHKYNDLPKLMNVSTVDLSKPLQLADGTGVTFLYVNDDGEIKVRVHGDSKSFRLFYTDGSHKYGDLADLVNVPVVATVTVIPAPTPAIDKLADLLASIFAGAGITVRIA